jgi:hypothetical protein
MMNHRDAWHPEKIYLTATKAAVKPGSVQINKLPEDLGKQLNKYHQTSQHKKKH